MWYQNNNLLYLLGSLIVLILLYYFLYLRIIKFGKDKKYLISPDIAKKTQYPLIIIFCSIFVRLVTELLPMEENIDIFLKHLSLILIIIGISITLVLGIKFLKNRIVGRYNIASEDNLKARKVYTQFIIIENILTFIIIIIALGLILMSFSSIRAIGVSVLASAGIAGIILGFAAQKALATLLAGIQLAFTQPFRIDDAVVIDGEWGWIEEITLTYVVLRIWDKRRLIIPSTYFIENNFQNWTRTTADITGSVFLYTDFMIPISELRTELTRLLNESPLWDKKVNVLQITNASEKTMEIRILVSAANSPTVWDLRVHIREKMIEFIQKNYPNSLPHSRILLSNPSNIESLDSNINSN